jgi:hypothetical protein
MQLVSILFMKDPHYTQLPYLSGITCLTFEPYSVMAASHSTEKFREFAISGRAGD